MLANPAEVATLEFEGRKGWQRHSRNIAPPSKCTGNVTGIHRDVPMTTFLEALKPGNVAAAEIDALCDEMDFGNRLRERLARRAA
ncbi:MAG: hypothetical protein U5O39_15155 [Gammaproteobacteria bacterium]|nr:hypothetical protein [Gammaproteobacteria bacterium]